VDDHVNCEDIAMNLMVTGMTGAKPVAIMTHVDDFGTTSGISIKAGHMSSRSTCMTDLISLFGKDTLQYNREVFLPFRRKKPVGISPLAPNITLII
jgi:glycogenin